MGARACVVLVVPAHVRPRSSMVARALVLTRRSAETDSFKHVELGTGYAVKAGLKPTHTWVRGVV